METTRKFKQLAVQITLKSIDKEQSDWITFNDKINTKIIGDDYFRSDIMLLVNELPIMECDLKNSYFLITTDRIISVIDGFYDEVFFIEMNNISNEYNTENFKQINGKYPKTNIIAVKKNDNTTLIAKIDSYYPAYFAKMLIYNIFSYKKLGKWYVNPK